MHSNKLSILPKTSTLPYLNNLLLLSAVMALFFKTSIKNGVWLFSLTTITFAVLTNLGSIFLLLFMCLIIEKKLLKKI